MITSNNRIIFIFSLCFVFIFVFSCSSKSDSNNNTPQSSGTKKFMENEPDGFRDLKWGDPPSKLKDKRIYANDGSGVLGYLYFIGEDKESLNSTVKGGILTNISNYPVLNKIENYLKPKDDDNLGGLKISRQSAAIQISRQGGGWENPSEVYYYFYKKRFFLASVNISRDETNNGKDMNKILDVVSGRYGNPTDKYITSNEEQQKIFNKKYQLSYPLYYGESKNPIPLYIWEGKKSLVIQREHDVIWLFKDVHDGMIRDAKEHIEKFNNNEIEVLEKGKGKGF